MFSASLLHAYLYEKNRKALIAAYGKKAVDEKMCSAEIEPMDDGGTAIDIRKETRKEWLSNLYTVCRCYLYQISEGNYQSDEFYWKFSGWIGKMAEVLAEYVVEEVRPLPPNPAYRPWCDF
ncbi:MAG: hypothetical protein J6Q22_09430 [Prevotella sp.]|nr:hypothetical protein [Prevotella sp.]